MRKKVKVFAVLWTYVVTVVLGIVLGLALPHPEVGLLLLLVLGLPWNAVAMPFAWAIAHDASPQGIIFGLALFTLPNIVVLLNLHINEGIGD